MLNLLCFEDASIVPFLIIPIVFIAIFAVVIVAAVKRVQAEQRRQREQNQQTAQYSFTDGNGRTEHQRDYLNAKRRELASRKIDAQDGSHTHSGKVETYDRIVGSLGEVYDEGCDELDGVRLIEHDESYCDDADHIISSEPTELERAIVIGEVLNTPRFKEMYRRKR